MKKSLIIMAATATMGLVGCGSGESSSVNPFMVEKWETPHQTAPFEQIKIEHYVPAITAQIEEAKAEINAIVNQRSVPTFENTVVALENSGKKLSRTLGVLFNLNSANTSDEMQQVVIEVTPMITEHSNDISLNAALFDRIKQVYDRKDELNLDAEDAMLLESTYKSFSRSGANLSDEDKETYRKISGELAELSVSFDQNELAANNAFTINITDSTRLSGIPASVVEVAKEEAASKGKEGWLFTLQFPSYLPVMKYADDRDLREEMFRGRGSQCATGDSTDNQENIKKIVNLRLEMANLLGYNSYADYALENRMAGDAKTVNDFLAELTDKTISYARKDLKVIEDYAKSKGFEGEFMGWDFSYWNEKYVTEKFQVNDEMTKPYFKLEDAEKALFMLAEKLYGITFVENREISVYHPDVIPYEVYDENGAFIATLYCDYFPRESKGSGAWMNSFREAYITPEDSTVVTPIIVLVNNFPKPTANKPSLLSIGEFETMLHEFGHGLHGILGKGKYASQTGPAVYRDFVELPSQLMENWANEKEYLDLFAKHYETGEKMPQELMEKIKTASNHNAAFNNIGQVRYATIDMAWHSITEPMSGSVEVFEKNAVKDTQVSKPIDGLFMSPAFGHIFSGGYAAGYYSYKWAELLDADAFSIFKKAGIFNKETADSFRRNVLEKGGSEDPMTLYVRFAGRKPTIEPLIERMGLKAE